jgi:hypothetical protein
MNSLFDSDHLGGELETAIDAVEAHIPTDVYGRQPPLPRQAPSAPPCGSCRSSNRCRLGGRGRARDRLRPDHPDRIRRLDGDTDDARSGPSRICREALPRHSERRPSG